MSEKVDTAKSEQLAEITSMKEAKAWVLDFEKKITSLRGLL